jgi:hypothetical protein
LWDGLSAAYDLLGFDQASGRDEVFRQLVLARIIEPTSKQDSLRVLAETGVEAVPSYATLKRRLPVWATEEFRRQLVTACARHAALGPASLVLYDVSTLYFETDAGDGFREPGFSKERRLEPQITIGLLTDAAGFPLMVEAFEGNTAETTTMLPTIRAFMAAHRLADVTIVADAGMVSETNRRAIEAEGLSFILGAKIPDIPYVVGEWRRQHPDRELPDGLILTQPRPAGPSDRRRDEVVYYQYRSDRARRTLRGIDEQVIKAERAVAGKAPVKRNRFIKLVGADKSVNRTLEAKVRTLAGWKGYADLWIMPIWRPSVLVRVPAPAGSTGIIPTLRGCGELAVRPPYEPVAAGPVDSRRCALRFVSWRAGRCAVESGWAESTVEPSRRPSDTRSGIAPPPGPGRNGLTVPGLCRPDWSNDPR